MNPHRRETLNRLCREASQVTEISMAKGLCRVKDGWATQDSVWVEYDDGSRMEVPEEQYRSQGYQPPFDNLPFCKDDKPDA
jgi:hypothetical protein